METSDLRRAVENYGRDPRPEHFGALAQALRSAEVLVLGESKSAIPFGPKRARIAMLPSPQGPWLPVFTDEVALARHSPGQKFLRMTASDALRIAREQGCIGVVFNQAGPVRAGITVQEVLSAIEGTIPGEGAGLTIPKATRIAVRPITVTPAVDEAVRHAASRFPALKGALVYAAAIGDGEFHPTIGLLVDTNDASEEQSIVAAIASKLASREANAFVDVVFLDADGLQAVRPVAVSLFER